MRSLRSLVLPLFLAIPLIWLGQDAYSCIRFKKPQGSVPPGLRDPKDPEPPTNDDGDAPTTPSGPDAPTTPKGPTTPNVPSTPGAKPTSPNVGGGTRKAAAVDEATWEIWWELNRIDFFPHRWVAPAISPDEAGRTPAGPQPLHPSVVDTKLWPMLLKGVDDKQVFTQEAALITMGRVAANEAQREKAREILVKKLDHRNHLIARSAALGLFYVANNETILPMYQRAMDKDVPEDVRAFLALTMTNLRHPMAPQLLKELADVKDGYYELVGAAIMGLGYVGAQDDASVPGFLESIAFGKKKVRAKYRALAVGSFGRMGDLKLGKDVILKALTDRETEVRRSAAMAAGVLDYRTDAERAIEAIEAPYKEYMGIPISPEDKIKIDTLKAQIRPQQAAIAKDVKEIVKALGKAMRDDKDSFVRRVSAISQGRIRAMTPHGALGMRFLRDQVKKDRLGMREFALLGLAIGGDEDSFETAERFLKIRNPSTRGAACIALGILANSDRPNAVNKGLQLKADEALRKVVNKDKHPYIRGYACLALGMVGQSSSAKLIKHTIKTTGTPETRAYGMLGLALLGTREGADEVVELIKSNQMRDGFVASHAVYSIGLTKDRRATTFDSLIERGMDRSDMYVQAAAIAAIGYLSSGEFYPRRHGMATGYNYRVGYDFIETYFYKL